MTDSSGPKHIIEGFSDDFHSVKEKYLLCSPNLRLEDFFAFWRNSHMDCLFANRFDPRELLESIVAMNEELVSILTDDRKDSNTRVIALYMLLCISAKQPCRLRRKLRLTCPDAIKIQDLCKESKVSRAHNDAEFCWYQLREKDGIDFVEERVVYGPSMLKNRRQRMGTESSSRSPYEQAYRGTLDFLDTKLEPAFEELDAIKNQYTQMRDTLDLDSVNDATDGLKSGTTVDNLLDHARSLLRDFKASQTL